MKTNAIPFSIELFETGDYGVCYRGRTEPLEELGYVHVLPPEANFRNRVIALDYRGELTNHSSDGLFNANQGQSCLDLLLVPKKVERKFLGMAYLNPEGAIISVRCQTDSGIYPANPLTPVMCTITLDE